MDNELKKMLGATALAVTLCLIFIATQFDVSYLLGQIPLPVIDYGQALAVCAILAPAVAGFTAQALI